MFSNAHGNDNNKMLNNDNVTKNYNIDKYNHYHVTNNYYIINTDTTYSNESRPFYHQLIIFILIIFTIN